MSSMSISSETEGGSGSGLSGMSSMSISSETEGGSGSGLSGMSSMSISSETECDSGSGLSGMSSMSICDDFNDSRSTCQKSITMSKLPVTIILRSVNAVSESKSPSIICMKSLAEIVIPQSASINSPSKRHGGLFFRSITHDFIMFVSVVTFS